MTPLLLHAKEYGVPINLSRGMYEENRDAAILYGTHASARNKAEFIHTELAEKLHAGHMAVYPLEAVTSLQNLWLSPVAVTPQMRRRPRLIFDFTRSGLNDTSESLSRMEAMPFGGALQRILKQILTADPCLGPVYLSKVYLADAYMRL